MKREIKYITSVEMFDEHDNKWVLLLSGDIVISVMTSAFSQVFRLAPKLRIKKLKKRKDLQHF